MKTLASIALALSLGVSTASSGLAADGRSPSLASYEQARKILDQALQAAGGVDALRAIKNVRRSGSGTVHNLGQSLRPDGPLTTRPVQVTSVLDFSGRRSRTETATQPSGGVRVRTVAVLSGEGGHAFNEVTRVATPFAPGAVAAARTALRRDPAALLLTAAGRAETLRFLGEHAVDGRPHAVVTFADADGTQIALSVDAESGLVSKSETLADHAILGDVVNEQVYSEHRPVGGVKLPFRVVSRTGGSVVQEITYRDVQVNAGVADALFELPAGAERVPPQAGPTNVTLTPVGDGAYFVAGSSHNSLLVAFRDHLVLVEAPQSVERAEAVIAKVRETVGDKPIRYVVPTHYHFDHSGGLRPFIARGATILTTPGNREFVERLAAAAHTVRPDALSREGRPAVVETFTGKKTLTDGARSLELHDLGPNPHVDELVVAYLPQERLAFMADVFSIPVQGPFPPAGSATREFAAKLQRVGPVTTIAPGHGRMGTLEDLEKALAVPIPQ
jgi:glyoxylase-like metal-dependent hydrolase (beta-lactamase superfamily II)